MATKKKNYKEDLKLLVSLDGKYAGEPFSIRFTSGRFGIAEFVCSYDGAEYVNCERIDDTHILCLLDNHGLPCGILQSEVRVFVPDSQMGDGDYLLVSKGPVEVEEGGETYNIELNDGVSDTTDVPSAAVALIGNVIKGKDGTINGYSAVSVIGDAVRQDGSVIEIDAYSKEDIDKMLSGFSPATATIPPSLDTFGEYDELYDDNEPVRLYGTA